MYHAVRCAGAMRSGTSAQTVHTGRHKNATCRPHRRTISKGNALSIETRLAREVKRGALGRSSVEMHEQEK